MGGSKMNYVIQDDRTDKEKKDTIGFIVAIDKFLSNFIHEGKSIVARPIRKSDDLGKILHIFHNRESLKYVRYVPGTQSIKGRNYKPKMNYGDHLHIYNFNSFNHT